MPKPTIEARLTKLEQQVALLVGAGASSTEKNASRSNGRPRQPLVSRNKWQQTLGVFGPEDGMDAVFEAAMKLREQDRKQTQSAEACGLASEAGLKDAGIAKQFPCRWLLTWRKQV